MRHSAHPPSCPMTRRIAGASTSTTRREPVPRGGAGHATDRRGVLRCPGANAAPLPPRRPVFRARRAWLYREARRMARRRRGGLRFDGAGAVELGVDLEPEKDGDVGQPQPDQEDDESGHRAVGLVVGREVDDVEREQGRDHEHQQDRDDAARADPLDAGLLGVGAGPEEQRAAARRRARSRPAT